MGICAQEFRELVIRPTLTHLEEKPEIMPIAENLLLGTAAQESGLGFHLKINSGTGIGIYQITPEAHVAVWDEYLIDNPDLASRVRGLASQKEFLCHPHAELATNLSYATAIAWMIYRRADGPLPGTDDIEALGRYWAEYFQQRPNADVQRFCKNYKAFLYPNGNGNIAA